MSENKVLLAGFESFGPYRYNVAERLVEMLNDQVIEVSQDTRMQIIGIKLPINFDTFREVLATAVQSIRPKIALGLGMDFKDLNHLSIELVAHSEPKYGNNIRDVEGEAGPNNSLDTLPEKINVPNEEEIKSAIADVMGIEASENAGRHMCETILRDLIRMSDKGRKFQPGFIHLPHTPNLLPDSAKLDKHENAMPHSLQKVIVRKVLKNIGTFYL